MPEFTFNEKEHLYLLDGKPILSVTQILQAAGIINYQGDNSWHMEKGKYLHEAIKLYLEDNLDRETLDPQLEPYLQGFEAFLKDTKFQVEDFERPIYHPQYFYAGTPDVWGVLNGKLILIDIKSGSPAKWHTIQLSAYLELLKVSGIEILSGANLYLADNKYNLKPITVRELQQGLSVFLSCLTVQKWKGENL